MRKSEEVKREPLDYRNDITQLHHEKILKLNMKLKPNLVLMEHPLAISPGRKRARNQQ